VLEEAQAASRRCYAYAVEPSDEAAARLVAAVGLAHSSLADARSSLLAEHEAAAGRSSSVTGGGGGKDDSGWPRLQDLTLSGVSVPDFDKLINGFTQLTRLVLDNMGFNGNQMVVHLTMYTPHPPPLQDLTLSAGGPLSEDAILGLQVALPSLTAVTFSNLDLPPVSTARLLSALTAHASTLASLRVHKNIWMDDVNLLCSVGLLTNLRQLELSQCDKPTGFGMVSLAGNLPHLTQLIVRACERVGFSFVREWERAVAAAAAASDAEGGPWWAHKQDVEVS
jgi:hypothetical protein